MNTTKAEQRLYVATNALLLGVLIWVILMGTLDAIGITWAADILPIGANILTLGFVLCIFAAWYVVIQYFMSRAKTPASIADYMLFLVAICMPIIAIYVLRKIRKSDA